MAANPQSSTVDRYRGSFDLRSFPAAGDTQLIYSRITRTAHLLASDTVRLLLACRDFASLEEHAVQLQREFNLTLDQAGPLRRQLGELAQKGLLVSERALVDGCRKPFLPEEPVHVAVIGIPTRNRPDWLERGVRSYAEAARASGQARSFLIVDDSDSPAAVEATRHMIAEVRREFGAEIHYGGPTEKAAYAGRLAAQSGVAPDVVNFALLNPGGFPVSTGASRNALLLACAGEAMLQVDDDTVCRLTAMPGARPGLVLASQPPDTEFSFFSEEEANALGAAGQVGDLAALHGSLLGKSVSQCVAEFAADGDLHLNRINTDFLRKLEARGGKVLAVSTGVVGNSGMGASNHLLTLLDPSRSRLLASESTYRMALAQRQILRGVVQATICDSGFCMALNLGLDSRTLLPPFAPVQRDQDGIFGACLRACAPDGFFGFLPWALMHCRPSGNALARSALWNRAANVNSNDLMLILIEFCKQPPDRGSLAGNLRSLGRAFADWGQVPLVDFAEHLRQLGLIVASRQIKVLEGRLRQFNGQPDFWAEDVRQCLSCLQNRLSSPDFGVPRDLRAAFGAESALPMMQLLVRGYGQLMQCWPDLWEAARQLRAAGQGLAGLGAAHQ